MVRIVGVARHLDTQGIGLSNQIHSVGRVDVDIRSEKDIRADRVGADVGKRVADAVPIRSLKPRRAVGQDPGYEKRRNLAADVIDIGLVSVVVPCFLALVRSVGARVPLH